MLAMGSIKVLRNYFNGLTLPLSSCVRYLRKSADHSQSAQCNDARSSDSFQYQQKTYRQQELSLLLPTQQRKAPCEPSAINIVNNSLTKIITKTVTESGRDLSSRQMPQSEPPLQLGLPQSSQLMPGRKDNHTTMNYYQHSMGLLCCALSNSQSFCLRKPNQYENDRATLVGYYTRKMYFLRSLSACDSSTDGRVDSWRRTGRPLRCLLPEGALTEGD